MERMRKFSIPRAVAGQEYASLQKSENYPADFSAQAGLQVKAWPQDLRFHMDPNFPKQIKLADYVKNLHGHLIVSAGFKSLLLGMQAQHVEALPLTIIDHKGKVASTDHCYLNLFPLVDAIDQDQSELDWNAIDTTSVSGCDKLVLDDARIPAGLHIFRLKHLTDEIVMSDELVKAIQAAKMTGIKFDRVEDFEC
jgi:hypothetical protein